MASKRLALIFVVLLALGSSVLKDLYAGKTYNEEMRVWTSLFTQYDAVEKKVVARYPNLAYDMEFSNDFNYEGIPICSAKNPNDNWANCPSQDDNSENHRMPVVFLGENWN